SARLASALRSTLEPERLIRLKHYEHKDHHLPISGVSVRPAIHNNERPQKNIPDAVYEWSSTFSFLDEELETAHRRSRSFGFRQFASSAATMPAICICTPPCGR